MWGFTFTNSSSVHSGSCHSNRVHSVENLKRSLRTIVTWEQPFRNTIISLNWARSWGRVRSRWDYWYGSLSVHHNTLLRTWGRAVERSGSERVGLVFGITEFDANCYPIRVPCSRWSWMTTWGWKSSLRLEWSQFPPARETAHQSRRCALSGPAAVLFLSHAAGDLSFIPSLSQSDVLSAADACFLVSRCFL